MTDLWRVRFVATEPELSAEAWLGEAVPTPSGGGGGHESIDLPKRRSVVVWRKAALYVMSVGIVFDDFARQQGVASDFADLVRMWRPLDEEDAPPTIRVDATGDAVPLQHLTWVVTGLDWGDAEANGSGNRARQNFTVTLLEYNPDESIDFPGKKGSASKARRAKQRKKSGSTSRRTVTVKRGDTLSEIADRNKVKGGWRALGEAQKPPIHDPRSIKVGQKLRLP